MIRWRNLTVSIASHTEGGGQNLGSGMLISDDLVLTANHVVNQKGAVGPVRLRWIPDSQNSADSCKYENAVEQETGDRGIVWYHDEADVALIKCCGPGISEFLDLARSEPVDGQEWYAETFLTLAQNSGKIPENCYLSGSVSSPIGQNYNSRFSLLGKGSVRAISDVSHDGAEYPNLANYGGVSGSSVVIKSGYGKFLIVGVIVTEDTRLSQTLEAVPIKEILNLKDCRNGKTFSGVVFNNSNSGPDRCFELLQNCLEEFLRIPAGRSLWQEHVSPLLTISAEVTNFRAVAENLVNLPISDSIDAVADIFDACGHDKAIKNSARKLACAIASVTTGRKLCPQASTGTNPLLPMLCGSPTGVEIGMSSVDGRMPVFRDRIAEGDLPRGLHCLEMPPEQGSTSRESLANESIHGHTGGDILDLVATKTESRAPKAFLKNQKRRGKPSYYLAPPVMENDRESLAQWEKIAQNMGEDGVEHVYIVPYDPNIVEQDEEFFGVLRSMLPLASE